MPRRFGSDSNWPRIIDSLWTSWKLWSGGNHRSMIVMPPRHGKTLLGTKMFAAWYLGRHPDRSIITACYGQELADDFGRQVRNLVNDPIHRAIFPECRLADDSTSMRRFDTTARRLILCRRSWRPDYWPRCALIAD